MCRNIWETHLEQSLSQISPSLFSSYSTNYSEIVEYFCLTSYTYRIETWNQAKISSVYIVDRGKSDQCWHVFSIYYIKLVFVSLIHPPPEPCPTHALPQLHGWPPPQYPPHGTTPTVSRTSTHGYWMPPIPTHSGRSSDGVRGLWRGWWRTYGKHSCSQRHYSLYDPHPALWPKQTPMATTVRATRRGPRLLVILEFFGWFMALIESRRRAVPTTWKA